MSKEYSEELLEIMYSEAEKKTKGYINRGDLITINGVCIHEIMVNEFMKNGIDFDEYYRENLRYRTREYVAQALSEGKYVEIFSLGADGSIIGEPEQLTEKGKKPPMPRAELEEKIMNSRKIVRNINSRAPALMVEGVGNDIKNQCLSYKDHAKQMSKLTSIFRGSSRQ